MTDYYKDFVFTRNTTTVAATDTSITVEDVSLFPSNGLLVKSQYYIAFESTLSYPPTFEIMQLTNVNSSTKTLTVIRGQANTVAVAHAIVTYIKGTLTSDMVRRARYGFSGTAAPAPDYDLFGVGDRMYHTAEGRYYAFTGQSAYLKDTFTRAASALTMGNTEAQTIANPGSPVPGQATITIPYTAPWIPGLGVFGINASGQAYYVSGGTGSVQQVNTGGLNPDFQFDVFNSATAGSDYGLLFRGDITGLSYGYYLQFLGTTATLYRLNSGGFTTTSTTTTFTTNTVHTWRVVCTGNNITIYRDGTSVMSYTDVTAGFVISGTLLYGANVGFRIGNATATTDSSIYFDNFSCTLAGNTALNTPVSQGWAPTANIQGYSSYALTQLATVEADILTAANQLDDMLPVVQGHDTFLVSLAVNSAAIAQQSDDILSTLQASVNTTGVVPPTSSAIAGAIYSDTLAQRLYIYTTSGSWAPITFAGPGGTPAAYSPISSGSGTPTSTILTAGSLYQDTNSNAIYIYTGGFWLGVTPRVVTTVNDYTAFGNDYILADSTGKVIPAFDVSNYNTADTSTTSVSVTPTKINSLFVGLKGYWNVADLYTATLDGSAMTKRRFSGGPSSGSTLFTYTGSTAISSHTASFTGGATSYNISWNTLFALSNCTTTGAVYGGVVGAATTTITLPSPNSAGVIIFYLQVNGSNVPTSITSTGGITFTYRNGASHGGTNSSAQFTALYTPAQSGTSITITHGGDQYSHTQIAAFPATSAVGPITATISLPSGLTSGRVFVQNNDPNGSTIQVQALGGGLLNGLSIADSLTSRYQGGLYVSNGTNWFKTTPSQQAWQTATLVNSWANAGGVYAPASYYLADGRVYLRGVISSGVSNTVSFTLPVGYRPEYELQMSTVCPTATPTVGYVDITAAGIVTIVSYSGQIDLDEISFRQFG